MENNLRQNVVVFTGAGISAESGLSTFRDKNGLWKQYNAEAEDEVDGKAVPHFTLHSPKI